MEINLDAMFLGNLSSDSVASSLLKTINSNHNLQKKKAATPCNTWTQQTNSSTEKGSLWDYSDIFGQEWEQGGQEWEQGLGTSHRVLGDTKPTAPVKDSSKDSQARQSGGEKNKSAQNSVEKKLCQGRSSLSSDKSKLSDKPENKTQYASKRPSFKEELEAWRLRNLQSKSSNLKELAHESQGKCAPLKLPVKRRNEDSLVKKDSKRQMKQQEWYSSEEESSDKEVYSFEDLMKEEERSARIAAKEDAEEYRKEQERKRKKKLKRLAMKQKRE